MKRTDIPKMQQLLTTATDCINDALELFIMPDYDVVHKRKIYVTQQRPNGCKDDEGWSILFADLNRDEAQEWVDSHNAEDNLFHMEYRVLTIDLYID